MCNFIIRPIKCYVTVDIALEAGENNDIAQLECGNEVEVSHVVPEGVVVRKDKQTFIVPLEVFVHTFSDKKPEDKKAKESKEPKKD